MKIPLSMRKSVISGYLSHIPVTQLAKRYGVTRQAIYKVLWAGGIDTAKKLQQVSCDCCGKLLERDRGRIRRQLHHFCGYECYYAWINAGDTYIQSREGQRKARRAVSEHFALLPGYVVHHEDRNCLNNSIYNLRVFASQSDHIRYHRGMDIAPIWSGLSTLP